MKYLSTKLFSWLPKKRVLGSRIFPWFHLEYSFWGFDLRVRSEEEVFVGLGFRVRAHFPLLVKAALFLTPFAHVSDLNLLLIFRP